MGCAQDNAITVTYTNTGPDGLELRNTTGFEVCVLGTDATNCSLTGTDELCAKGHLFIDSYYTMPLLVQSVDMPLFCIVLWMNTVSVLLWRFLFETFGLYEVSYCVL